MDSVSDRLDEMLATTGDEFVAAAAEGGVLRTWLVSFLAEETGQDEGTVETAIEAWISSQHPDDGTTRPLPDRIDKLLQARRQIDGSDDPIEAAFADAELGAALADAGRSMEAMARFMAARQIFTDHQEPREVGVADMEIAMLATDLGWYTAARRSYARARALVAQYGTVADFARVLVNEANLDRAEGDNEVALDLAMRGQWLAYEAGEARLLAVATHNIANIASGNGDLDVALEYFTRAKAIYTNDLGDPIAAATCDKNAGAALIDTGQYEAGLDLARTSLDTYTDHGHPIEAAYTRLTMAHALDHLDRHEEAKAELDQARAAFEAAHRLPDIATTDVYLSHTLRYLGQWTQAEEACHRVRAAYSEMGRDTDDPWLTDTLAAIERRETDEHDHGAAE